MKERSERERMSKEEIWADRKRTLFGLPWSFTRYSLTDEKLVIDTGFFSRHQEVVRLYRIKDVSLDRSLGERLFGLGTITCASSDSTAHNFSIKRVKCSPQVAEALSDLVEEKRKEMRVGMREFSGDIAEATNDDDGFMFFDNM